MRRACALAALLLALGAPPLALAVQYPVPGAVDPRIQTVDYDPDEVVALEGHYGYQLMLEFGPDERIENVSIGDALAWQVTPNRRASLLFIKPVESAVSTNMTVVTDRRRYAFQLTPSRARSPRGEDIAYVVRFTYPPEPVVEFTPPPPPPPPERRNLAYTYTGSRAALPSLVFDDGKFTYFQWPESVSTPALFLAAADGSESIVNYGVREGYVVVEQLAPRFVLRNGTAVTTVINNGWVEPVAGQTAPRPADARTAKEEARAGVPPR